MELRNQGPFLITPRHPSGFAGENVPQRSLGSFDLRCDHRLLYQCCAVINKFKPAKISIRVLCLNRCAHLLHYKEHTVRVAREGSETEAFVPLLATCERLFAAVRDNVKNDCMAASHVGNHARLFEDMVHKDTTYTYTLIEIGSVVPRYIEVFNSQRR